MWSSYTCFAIIQPSLMITLLGRQDAILTADNSLPAYPFSKGLAANACTDGVNSIQLRNHSSDHLRSCWNSKFCKSPHWSRPPFASLHPDSSLRVTQLSFPQILFLCMKSFIWIPLEWYSWLNIIVLESLDNWGPRGRKILILVLKKTPHTVMW